MKVRTCGEILIDLVKEHSFKAVAEIGVYEGGLSAWILSACPEIESYYLVDPWLIYPQEYRKEPFGDYSQAKWDEIFQGVLAKIAPFSKQVIVLRMTSVKAAQLFSDNALDLVYIDAIHTYEAVLEDIKTWLPKIKSSGIISGHDWWDEEDGNGGIFFIENVVRAIREVFEDKIIQRGYPSKAWDHVWWVSKADL